MPNLHIAPSGSVFVCLACGKTSRDIYGEQKISPGWDESCMLSSRIVREDKLVYSKNGRLVVEIKENE